MRDLRRWILVGLAVAVVGVAAIGYGFIATGIATPPGDNLGTVLVPDERGAVPVFLADGRPAFVVRTAEAVHVLDARAPVESGSPSGLVAWCEPEDFFNNGVGLGIYAPDGGLIAGASGLISYPVTMSDGRDEAVVGRDGRPQPEVRIPGPFACDAIDAVAHQPDPEDVFDPSVASDEEPPGWIWLEGRLEARDGQVVLCDGPGPGCATGALVRGIDPAKLAQQPQPLEGLFIGRIGDGVLDEVHFAPFVMRGR